MNILIIGGNGNISWWCTSLCVQNGYNVWVINRGKTTSTRRSLPNGVMQLYADVYDYSSLKNAVGDLKFNIVVNFICFNEIHARDNVKLFANRTDLFVFISSESIYSRINPVLPFREESKLWDEKTTCSYISGKILAEQYFLSANKNNNFPVLILRPGYTYDTIIPIPVGHNCFTACQRILDGKSFLIPGSGHNLWTFTHSRDFAAAFIGIINSSNTLGKCFNVMSNYTYTWNNVVSILSNALGVKSPGIIFIPEEAFLDSFFGKQEQVALSKINDAIFDTAKIHSHLGSTFSLVSLEEGLPKTLTWLYQDIRRIRIDNEIYNQLDSLEAIYGK